MSFRPRYFRRSTWLRAWRSAVLWLCVVTLALQPLESLAAIRQQTQVAIGAPAALSADPSVRLQKGARTAEYAAKDISFAAVSAVGLTPRPPQLTPLPSPPRQSLTLSGAQPPYPPNHVLDGSVEVVGTPPANHDFETTAVVVGTPPTNHDMAAASYTSGTPPTNHDFEMGTLTGWATSGSVSIQSNATQGYYASLGASGVLTSTAFTVESDAQQLAVAIGYLHAILSSYVEIYVLSGTNYATQTKIGTFFCQNCGWRQETFDLTAYAGQSIQLKFRRTGGTIGIDAPQARVVLPGYATTGVVERVSEADGNVHALLSANTAIVSSPFAVANDAQQATLRISGRSSSIDYYAVYVLSGPDYATATQVVYESVEDSWKTTEFDLTAWRGQSIRLRVARAGGAIGVEDVGVQRAGSESYAYDALDRLTSVGYTNGDTVSYGYDVAGKRLTETLNGVTTTYDYDAAGQVVSNGVLSYTYDANGNLTGAGSDAYAWDWANRLAGASVGSSSIAYSYDALGVRTGAVVDGVASSLLWDRAAGQLVDDGAQGYVQAPGVLAQLGAAGRGDLLADGTGSVRGIADASGVLVGTADFGVFGQNRGQAGVTSGAGFGGAFWTAALRDQSQAPAGLVSAALFGALPTPTGSGGSNSVSTALAHLERLQQVNPTPNRFVGSAEDTDGSSASWGGFGGGGAPVGSPALALLLPQANDPEPANRLPGPYTYASHRPTHGNGGTSALPGANPGLFAAWLLGLEANEDPGGLIGLGQAIVRVFLYVACVLDGECLASLTELQALGEELGSAAQVRIRWTGKLLSRAADLWSLLPNIPRPLADLLSLGVGFIPVVGDLYDLYCGLTGYDPITGERRSGVGAGAGIGGGVPADGVKLSVEGRRRHSLDSLCR